MHAGLIQQDGRGTDSLGQVEYFVESWLSQVGVDHRNTLTRLREGNCEIGGDCRLAFGRRWRGNDAADA
jgi:hypothetical protein